MNRDLILVMFSMMIWGAGEGMFYMFQPLYMQQLGADPVMIGGILGALGLAMTVAQAPAGYLADRIGGRPLMWLAWGMGAAAAGIMALAQSLPVFVVGLLIYGLTAFVTAPMSHYIADVRGRWSVSRAFTLTQAGYNLGAIGGPILGGWVGLTFGLSTVYKAAFGFLLMSVLVIVFIRRQPKTEHQSQAAPVQLHRNTLFLGLLPFFFLTTLVTFLPQTLTPNFLQNQHSLDYGQIGQLGAIGSAGIVLTMLALGNLPPLLGILIGQAAIGVYGILLWQGTGFPWFAAAYLFVGGYRLTRMMMLAFARPLVPGSQTGFAFGLIELVNGMALFIAPFIAGWIYSIQPWALYITGLLLGLGVFVLNLSFLPGLQRKVEKFQAEQVSS
jgi:MFS family permease